MMKNTRFIPLMLPVTSLLVTPVMSAVSYNWGTYIQNFDTLNGVTTWQNNETLQGWYARTDATASITTIGSNTGSTTTAGLYSFGVLGTNALSERSLGFATTNGFTGAAGTAFNYLGLNLANDTSYTLTTITITYDGEQWRRDNTNAHEITVEYSFNATSLTSGTWTNAGSSLTFVSPQTGTALALDGNAPANSARGLTSTIGSLAWAPGSNLWIRFKDLNDSGNDHFLAIDNVEFSAIPEPSAAFLGSLGLLGLLRRRR